MKSETVCQNSNCIYIELMKHPEECGKIILRPPPPTPWEYFLWVQIADFKFSGTYSTLRMDKQVKKNTMNAD